MNSNNNFEVKYTLRLYDPSIITELATQYEKAQKHFKNKNEFIAHTVKSGLDANRKNEKTINQKVVAEEHDIYNLLLNIFKYISQQFKKIYIDHNIIQKLLCNVYNILLSHNNDERLFYKKIEDGFYDDLPSRFLGLINDLEKRYGLS